MEAQILLLLYRSFYTKKMPDDGPYENRNMHLKTKI